MTSRQTRRLLALAALPLVLAACGDDPAGSTSCDPVMLPFSGGTNAPRVTHVGLEVQESGIVLVATATDPQGTANLLTVQQSMGVYRDAECRTTPIMLEDDLSESGVEETFGTAVDAAQNATLYNTIAAAATWPVLIDFKDIDGNRSAAVVRAQVLQ